MGVCRICSSFTQVVQIILPTVFILKFISIIPILAFSDIIYCILVMQYKNPSVQYGDIYNTLVGFLLGVVVAWIVMDLRVRDNIIKDRFQKMSSIDLLTGILNKRTCEENIAEYLKKRDECYSCALVVLDIDDFKHVNDRLGHHFGDVLLEGFGSLLTHTFRTSDIIGRIGGDEFMILMRNVTDYKILDYKYNQLQNGIKKLGELIGYTVTCSAGFAVAEEALLLGATDIIHKPFEADVVKSKVECILKKRVL